jgi:hypothetical protein
LLVIVRKEDLYEQRGRAGAGLLVIVKRKTCMSREEELWLRIVIKSEKERPS